MSSNVIVVGEVNYREGDGPMMPIRHGLCEMEAAEMDVTLGWQDGNNRLSAVMPRDEFERLVRTGAIKYQPGQ